MQREFKILRFMMTTVLKPQTEIATVDALWALIQTQSKAVRKELALRLLSEQQSKRVQQKMVEESLSRAFEELHAGKVNHDARNLFAK